MKTSKHAEKRFSQRALSEKHAKFVMDYGTRKGNSCQCVKYKITKKDFQREHQRLKEQLHLLEKLKGIEVILDTDETIIITMYKAN